MLIEDFMRAPAVLANQYTLYPNADQVMKTQILKSLAIDGVGSMNQVKGATKIGFCDIVPCETVHPLESDMSRNATYSEDRFLHVLQVTSARRNTWSEPCYYLPWRQDSGVRIKLRPSRKNPSVDDGAALEPRLFVTAALQGCSVIVSGDPTEPVVYHLNAQSVRGPDNQTLQGSDGDFQAAAQAKIQSMDQLATLAETRHPKVGWQIKDRRTPFGGEAPNSKSASLLDYMSGMQPTQHLNLKQRFQNRFGVNVAVVSQFGTVFGIRTEGSWVFYRQTRTRFGYPLRNGGPFVYTWMHPVCQRFWP